jgi:hypothetical protein
MADRVTNPRAALWGRLYIPLAILLIGFGVVALASIGLPFFVVGTAMALLWPLRQRWRLFTSLLVGSLVFVIVVILLAPLGCTSTATTSVVSAQTPAHTSCDNILGLNYRGTEGYNAPLWPAVVVGAAGAALAASTSYLLLRRRPST